MSGNFKQLCRNVLITPKIFEIAERDVAVGYKRMVRGLQYFADTYTSGYYLQNIFLNEELIFFFYQNQSITKQFHLTKTFLFCENSYTGNFKRSAVKLY